MLDLGLLTVPAIAALSVFVIALFIGEDVVIEKIDVPYELQWSGYSSIVATRQFVDEMRDLGEGAASEITDLDIDPTSLQEGVGAFEDYFELSVLVNGTRNIFGMIPYYVEGEIAQKSGELVLTIRVFAEEDKKYPVSVIVTKGTTADMGALMREAAIGVTERVNPYVVVLYYRQTELAAGQYDFAKTQAAADRYFASQPLDKHFLVYALLGRMHMLKAERDASLTPAQKEAEYDKAMTLLTASITQHKDLVYPYINLGLIHATRGETAIAEQYYARAVQLNPNYLVTRKVWGDLLVKEGRLPEAAIQYVAAVEIERKNADLRDKLARVYAALGMPEAARQQWEEALVISPTTAAYADSIKALDAPRDAPAEGGVPAAAGGAQLAKP